MANVKWIKITTDIFDDEKILLIESLPDAYAIITVWFKLLCMAGKQNNSGVFMLGKIAYTDKMLATIFRMKEATVSMALQTFEQFGMVEIVDGVITIPNWDKHQSLDKFELAKENTRKRVARHREKQKLIASGNAPVTECNVTSNVTGNAPVTECNTDRIRIDKEEDIEKEEEKECISSPPKNSSKIKLGKYQNVFLTPEEYTQLKDNFPSNYQARIENLSAGLELYGDRYKYNNHYLAILKWAENDKNKKPESSKASYDINELEKIPEPPKTVSSDPEVKARAEALKLELQGG